MLSATEVAGPFTILLRDGIELTARGLDGGGIGMDEADELTGAAPVYEVHGEYLDGSFLSVPQDQIEAVRTADGTEVEFGNPYYPGHPRPRDIDTGELIG